MPGNEFETLVFTKEGGIATVLMNRPQVMNAMNHTMFEELVAGFKLCETDIEIRAVILKGTGRAFCTGDDLKSGGAPAYMDEEMAYQGGYLNVVRAIRRLRKPVIASVHGYALAAGLDLALACDLVFAAEDAKLGTAYVQRGFTGGTYLLPQFVGLRKAIEMLFTGEMIDGREAERIGLINRAVPVDQLQALVDEWADRFATAATKAIAYSKMGLYVATRHRTTRKGSRLFWRSVSQNTRDCRVGKWSIK
jgi:enoyl-CoA hydratase/carnithine racemase